MKKIVMSVAFATLFGLLANAQRNQDGVYLSQSDFENNKLSYATNSGSKVRFNEFLDKPFITVNKSGKKEKLFKDEIFAYQHNGNVTRTWNFAPYIFLEKGVIWIYSREEYVSKGKGIRREKKYYYSVSGKDEILPLVGSSDRPGTRRMNRGGVRKGRKSRRKELSSPGARMTGRASRDRKSVV